MHAWPPVSEITGHKPEAEVPFRTPGGAGDGATESPVVRASWPTWVRPRLQQPYFSSTIRAPATREPAETRAW